MVKTGIFVVLSTAALNVAAQNQAQQFYSNINLTNQIQIQQRAQLLLASNISNENKINSVPVRNVNNNSGNKTNQSVQRRPIQNNIQRNINPPDQIMNDDIQIQMNVMGNNIGIELNNSAAIQIQRISNVALPDLPQIGMAGIELKVPKVNWSIKTSSLKTKTLTHSKKKYFKLNNRLKKINRNLSSKLLIKRKLRIRIDDCFKW